MHVIHAQWAPAGKLSVWGEDPKRSPAAPPLRGRPPKTPRPRKHPFASDPRQLIDALTEALAFTPVTQSRTELTITLPSATSGPHASPRLLREKDPNVGPVTHLAPWIVSAVELEASDSLDLVTSAPPRASVGDSMLFFAEVAKLALELVARGRVLPALDQRGERWAAVWRPAPATADDAARLRLLVAAMPPSCRAGGSPEGWEPEAVLHHALGALVDVCARGALDRRDVVPVRRGRVPRSVAVQESWRRALAAPDPFIDGDPDELELLHKSLEDWAYPARGPAARALRTCFRLGEPESKDARWRLEILLQSMDDPSLLVPAETVWEADTTLEVLHRTIEDPQEWLLADLGRALRVCPALAAALDTATPTTAELDAAAAYRFLVDSAGALEMAGFGVLVPPWWKSGAAKLGAKLEVAYKDEARVTSTSLLGVEGLCSYRWKVAVGNDELTLKELKQLARLKSPLVKVRGHWIELRPDDVKAALLLFERTGTGETSLGDALRAGLGLASGPAGPSGLPVVGIEATGRLKELFIAGDDGRAMAMATPAGFSGELRPYQERGVGWLAFLERLGLGACLADDMGLGKTPTLLALLVAEREATARRRGLPSLVVCPMSVVGNWERGAARFTPSLRVHVHHGSQRLAGRKFERAAKASDVVLTTYALVARETDLLGGIRWDRVVLDEAQNIKNAGAKQSRAVRALKTSSRIARGTSSRASPRS